MAVTPAMGGRSRTSAAAPATPRATDAPILAPDSLGPILEQIVAAVPPVLLDAEARDPLLRAAGALPSVLAKRSLGLKLRLQGPATGDLFVTAVPDAPEGKLLHRALLFGSAGGDPAIGRLTRTLSEWRTPDSWVARSCASLLLELDAHGSAGGGAAPPPCLYLWPRCVTDSSHAGGARATNGFHDDPFGLLSALAQITGSRVNYAMCAAFKSLLEALPESVEMLAAGATLSREAGQAPCVTFRGFAAADIKPFLKETGRKSAAKTLAPVAKALESVSSGLCVTLDIGPHATDVVGLEVYTGAPSSTAQATGWRALFDALVDRGLADTERADAALTLIGRGADDDPASGLSHVKITTVDGSLAPTKVYVGYEHAHCLAPHQAL